MKNLWITIIISSILLLSCKEINKLTHFYMNFSMDISVEPSSSNTSEASIWLTSIGDDFNNTIETNNSNIQHIEDVLIRNVIITIPTSSSKNQDNLKSIVVYIYADGQDLKKIAWLDDAAENKDNIYTLITSEDDLKEYFLSENNITKIEFTYQNQINTISNYNIQFSYFIGANLINT